MNEEEIEERQDEAPRIAIDVTKLHLVTPDEAAKIFDAEIGSGTAWASPLMQYRTTSDFQRDWKIEVGNWLERGRRLGYLEHIRRNILPQQQAIGERGAGDAVHRSVTQQLAQAQTTHYLVGTGWTFQAWEPKVTEKRANGTPADVDLQLAAPSGQLVEFQVKASGQLGVHNNEVDEYIQKGVRKAAAQLPTPAARPALIVMLAQRDWSLSADIDVIEEFIGSTVGYPNGVVLLRDDDRGEFSTWRHTSGILVLDHRRGIDSSDYGCVFVQNPWADHPVDPAWFPHARSLICSNGAFTWLRGHPNATTFPTGTRMFGGTVDDAMQLHGL